jgi:hypothetical protein
MNVCEKLITFHHIFSMFGVPMIIRLKYYNWSIVMAAAVHALLLIVYPYQIIEIAYTIAMVINNTTTYTLFYLKFIYYLS